MYKVLIIEDEIKTAKDLQSQIQELREDMEVIAILPSIKSALSWFNENPFPDLIFSDIQLADGLSFEIFKQIKIDAPIVFCTAFDEYAIQAFDANGIDYLLKPIDEEKLSRGLAKYDKLSHSEPEAISEYQKQVEALLNRYDKNYKNSILIHFQEKIIPVKTEDISFIHSESGIVTIFLLNNQRHITNHTLDALDNMLDPNIFYKANRQFIINRKAINSIEHYFTRRLVVKLNTPTPEQIIISKAKSSEFLKWVEK